MFGNRCHFYRLAYVLCPVTVKPSIRWATPISGNRCHFYLPAYILCPVTVEPSIRWATPRVKGSQREPGAL